MLIISDETHIVDYEKSLIKKEYQKQLINSLSHEQFTPLNMILNYSRMLEEYIEDSENKSPHKSSKKIKIKKRKWELCKHGIRWIICSSNSLYMMTSS